MAIGRLKNGVSVRRAQAELTAIQIRLAAAYPNLGLEKRVVVKRYREVLTGNVRPALLALQFAVLAVWLIACANVASLLLSRTTGRRREIAIRSAVGAGRARIIRQFLTESLVLAFSGAAVGLALAFGCVRLLKFYMDLYLPLSQKIHIDFRVAAMLVVFSIISAVLFGLVPAIQASRAPAQEALARRYASRRHQRPATPFPRCTRGRRACTLVTVTDFRWTAAAQPAGAAKSAAGVCSA